MKKQLEKAKKFSTVNKKLLLITLGLILGFIAYNSINTKYHKKEIKVLEQVIEQKEEQFQEVVAEKEKLQDSSNYFEELAYRFDEKVEESKAKAERLRKEKQAILDALRDLPIDVIDSFFVKRYADITPAYIGLEIDQNVGNEIVVELVEKDHLVQEVAAEKETNTLLTGQVDTLKISLDYSKLALYKADSAIAIRNNQLKVSKDLIDLLNKDLKTAKRKAFWNNFKGVAIGIAAGVTVGILAK
jgi:cell division protein FtsB